MLDKCKEFGKDKVLLTCDKENIASRKTIIANGGILENTIEDKVGLSKSGLIERYNVEMEGEILFNGKDIRKFRKQSPSIGDLSAVVTGLLLALTLPPTAPWWLPVVGTL